MERRIYSIGFRFGWSKREKEDSRFGSGPYCLTVIKKTDKGITEGLLSPKEPTNDLPNIRFVVSQNPEDDFHLALYGSKSLLRGSRRNVQAHTPIGFYVLTNEPLIKYSVPWNLKESKDLISEIFMREEVFFSPSSNITKVFPPGAALVETNEKKQSQRPLEFVIPDYLPKCTEVATQLTERWKTMGNAKAVCRDIVTFVYAHVFNSKRDWDGFIVGVNQSDPGRHTVEYEFFSSSSPNSWTYQSAKPENLYYLAGVGQSLITVDGKRICGLRPNLFGLGDVFVTDLIACKHGWFSE